MRRDALGLFWDDIPVVKVKSEKAAKPKRTPPPRTWESADYLPNLAEAREFKVDLYTDLELMAAAQNRERLVLDIECYPNYFLIGFKGTQTGKVVYFEQDDQPCGFTLNIAKLNWILQSFCVITFNGTWYDLPMAALALAGKDCATLKQASDKIIVEEVRASDLLKSHKVKKLAINHIDLIEVAPGAASLKTYSGRMHARRMQDLPFHPNTVLSDDQIAVLRWYWVNDLDNTILLNKTLLEQIQLREALSTEYNIDLRSKSDAQIAEAVISEEVSGYNGTRCTRPTIDIGTAYKYQVPHFLQYQSPLMRWVLEQVRSATFVVDESGSVGLPEELKALKIQIADATYRMGIGGLHSSEKKTAHIASANVILEDRDVTSYYPFIILNQGLYPKHLGTNFLRVYRSLVERRLAAKKAGHTTNANSLKIVINGSFGKLGSKYSVLYSPDLLIQVTLTGQLSLLMLIERLELAGIPVVSANTDGIVMKCPVQLVPLKDSIVKQWEQDTGFETESTNYAALYSRDVNNYIAVKSKGGTKTKGVFATENLQKNPKAQICVDAIAKLLTDGVPVEKTILACKDASKFVMVQKVAGGAVKAQEVDGVTTYNYIGSTVRWYYATGVTGEIIYAKNGHTVSRTDGAKPLMTLPDALPADIDFDWYFKEADKILHEIGYYS